VGGVSCYSSINLTNWESELLALLSDAENPDDDLACENGIERPKVATTRGQEICHGAALS